MTYVGGPTALVEIDHHLDNLDTAGRELLARVPREEADLQGRLRWLPPGRATDLSRP
jgi:hypothetical protein